MSLIIGIGTRIGRRVNRALNKWHTVVSQLRAKFLYRIAGGADNDDLPESNGRAVINAICGNTVKWNQLINILGSDGSKTENDVTITDNRDGTYTVSTASEGATGATVLTTNVSIISGHKYLLKGCPSGGSDSTYSLKVSATYLRGGNDTGSGSILTALSTLTLSFPRITVSSGAIITTPIVFKPQLIDLTAIGIDNLTTVEEVEAWLALNAGTQDYYPHDEGSLISFKGQGIKSVGFNLFDKNNVLIGYWKENGDYTSAANYRRTRDYIPVFPETNYYIKDAFKNTSASLPALIWYDSNKNLISAITNGTSQQRLTNKIIQSPEGAAYVRFSMALDNLDVVSFNLSNPDKNGTYEPYWSDEKPFDVTKVYGKLRGEGSLVQVFPDGMFEGLSDRLPEDYIEYSYGDMEAAAANKKIDLGDCAWSLVSGCSHTFETTIDITKVETIGYTFSDEIDESDTTQNKLIGLVDGGSTKLALLDRSLSSTDLVSGHITALEGVDAVYYHPNVDYYLNLVYRDNGTDTPLEEIFPIKYKVDKYSTEEVLVPTGDAPTSTSMIADIEYQAR